MLKLVPGQKKKKKRLYDKKIKKRERKRDFFLFPSNFNFIFLNAAL